MSFASEEAIMKKIREAVEIVMRSVKNADKFNGN